MALVTFAETKVTRPRCGNRVGCDGSRSYRYTYNAQRQRTRKVIGPEVTVYHYDLQGNLLAETRADGTLIRDYVWLDATPITQIEAGEKIRYLHTDHLNTPRLATNPQGTVVWRWEGTAFGNTAPNEDVDGDAIKTTVNLRYPGQYYDAETGLHYNWNRYYDPRVGRYISSDPIGLRGGPNTYIYVRNNPIRWTDSTGQVLEGWEPSGLIGSDPVTGGLPGSKGSICGPHRFKFPEFWFKEACEGHDNCYDECRAVKIVCDVNFCTKTQQSCPPGNVDCQILATAYCFSVVQFGGSSFDEAQKKKCKTCQQ